MALSDLTIRKLKATDKPYKKADVLGLYLLVSPNGSKLWRYDYKLHGKRRTAALGSYPTLGLAGARDARAEIKRQIAKATTPLMRSDWRRSTLDPGGEHLRASRR